MVETSSTDDRLREMVDAHRRELHVHCYRMLGSIADADDALQETLVAAWRGLERFDGRSSARTWLYRIATNTCLNLLRTRGRRPVTVPLPPFDPPPPSRRSDAPWLQPYPDVLLDEAGDPGARHLVGESIGLAFVAALQTMPPRQVAALVLVDVLGFSLVEVAEMLDAAPTAVKGLLQRSRAAAPRPVEQPPSDDDGLAARFARAYAADDVDGVVALLTDDAWLAMPPAPHVYEGRDAVRAFLAVSTVGRGAQRLVATRANRQPAFACYGEDGAFTGVVVLSAPGARIAGVTRFLDATLAPAFGLPARLPDD